jgi:hypothetical protein
VGGGADPARLMRMAGDLVWRAISRLSGRRRPRNLPHRRPRRPNFRSSRPTSLTPATGSGRLEPPQPARRVEDHHVGAALSRCARQAGREAGAHDPRRPGGHPRGAGHRQGWRRGSSRKRGSDDVGARGHP